jgi:molybdopterin-guanine dinucleotide biosynthesis protein A
MTQLIGIVLAGGKSLRMGEDKSLLLINGNTMLEHMLTILSQTQVSKVMVNRNVTGTHESNEGRETSDLKQYIQDIIPNKGPLSGIHSALVNFPNADLLVVPVDMPMISAASLNVLISNARKHEINCRFALINANDGDKKTKSATMPLYIHNNSETRQKLEHTLLHSKAFSVYHFCSHFPILEVPLENESEMTNLNYPEQLSQLKKR